MNHWIAKRVATEYVNLGYNPLPMRPDRKAPALKSYTRYKNGEPIPEDWLDRWWSSGVQLCTGTPFGLAVVDLDGTPARVEWRLLCRRHEPLPPTWIVSTGGGGFHIYFSVDQPCPSRKIWGVWSEAAKTWRKHCFIEILCDRSLVVAPPSRHPQTNRLYTFIRDHDPATIAQPAPLPDWLREMPAIKPPRDEPPPVVPRKRPRRGNFKLDFADVLRSLSPLEKLDLARRWGLRLKGRPNEAGWMRCHALDREDNTPSASFNPTSGYYSEPATGIRMSIFDVAVATNAHCTAYDALREAALQLGFKP